MILREAIKYFSAILVRIAEKQNKIVYTDSSSIIDVSDSDSSN